MKSPIRLVLLVFGLILLGVATILVFHRDPRYAAPHAPAAEITETR